ncbi:MAG TPA: hypothetical protein VGS19_12350 [Streptosporangiaceae bacterium]|nr:hypothetical protein [Streptosporangiaceae bacterium]
MRLKRPLIALAVSTALTAGTVLTTTPAFAGERSACPPPTVIHAHGPEVFPHSGNYDPRNETFYVGSLKHSTISAVSLNGTVRTVVDDPELVSVEAVHVDEAKNRLLASDVDYGLAEHSSPATKFKVAAVAGYGLRTGRRLWYADLGALVHDGKQHLISDIALAPDGTAYAVDELSPTVFRIDKNGHATVFATSPLLAGTVDIPGFLNGIGMSAAAWMPGNYLLIAKADGTLVRLPLDHPGQVSQVRLSQPLAALTAGIRVLPNGSLAAVSSGLLTHKPAAVQLVHPAGNWSSATVTVTDHVADPVTSDLAAGPDGATYALSGGLAALLAGQPNHGFTLIKVRVR